MKFVVPLSPQSAGRPKFNGQTGRVTKTYMDPKYRQWRAKFDEWFIDYLNQTNNELINYLATTKNGEPIRNEETGKLVSNFYGYFVKVICVMARPKGNHRPFPFGSNTPDLDNLYKAVTDGMFESEPFKYTGLNDRWIQTSQQMKRFTALGTDEKPHIEVEIRRIEMN